MILECSDSITHISEHFDVIYKIFYEFHQIETKIYYQISNRLTIDFGSFFWGKKKTKKITRLHQKNHESPMKNCEILSQVGKHHVEI